MDTRRPARTLPITLLLLWLSVPGRTPAAASADGLWQDVPAAEVAARGMAVPARHRLVRADLTALERRLKRAPPEARPGPEVVISIPLPDGRFERFRLEESPVMAPALAARYPQIRTYRGTGVDDPGASGRFDLTPHGFHAILHLGGETFYLDPDPGGVADGRPDLHRSYARRDFRPERPKKFECHTEAPASGTAHRPALAARPLGDELRTYRIAIAATGEYTQFHGGTVAQGLAAVVTTLNRVDFIYEREVAVRLMLVADNDQIIYTDPATDPYTNNDGKKMLDENQTNLDAVIGSANYDIGHVLSTGGGGRAAVGVVCDDDSKARGVTGSSSPIGDPFDVDFVAHEIGHQFGANHTWNGTTGACTASARNAATAYEPGSGSTIMSYAGICDEQDLQPHTDDYFHGASIDEITDFVTLDPVGSSCGVTTATLNAPPSGVDAGPAFTLPLGTPFTLTGSASDPDGDALTFAWEEFDLGPAGDPNSPSGQAPIFRSFPPTTDPSRTFPRLPDLLSGTSTLGELLPTYARSLTFRLTARDNRAGGGGVDYASVTLTVTDAAGPFAVLSPNTAVSWTGGTSRNVTWAVAGTDTAPVNCTQVDILLSTDGGESFVFLKPATPNDGSETVAVPDTPTTSARIKVACTDNIFFDVSDTDFTILSAPSDLIFADGFEF